MTKRLAAASAIAAALVLAVTAGTPAAALAASHGGVSPARAVGCC